MTNPEADSLRATSAALPTLWGVARLAAAALILAAIAAQAVRTIGGAVDAGRDVATTVVNFFSFFTVLSNTLSVVVLGAAGAWIIAARRATAREPRGLAVALACVSTYMIVTGIVYNLLLRGVPLPQGTTVWWSNEVLHVVGPLFLLAEVLLRIRHRPLSWGAIGAVLVFPLAWSAYTMVRGPLVTNPVSGDPWWYPYPFLDPHITPGGYLGVAGYILGIAVAIGGVAWFVVWRRRANGPSGGSRG